ncbi:MAG: NAD(P)H-dependent oxidoreductase subunit E, partial [Ignavibacteriaceae bacterium]
MEFKFTQENVERINKEIAKYPVKKSAVMASLYIAQEQNGFISSEVIKEIAT